MRYTKHKLALFFTVQALGVAAMICLVGTSQHRECRPPGDCTQSPATMIVAIALIVGEIAVLAAALKNDLPVWRSLVGLGVMFLVAAFVGGLCLLSMGLPHGVATLLAIWHLLLGLILLASGAAAGFWDLLGKLRRADGMLQEDRESSAMWPLD